MVAVVRATACRHLQQARTPDRSTLRGDYAHDRNRAGYPITPRAGRKLPVPEELDAIAEFLGEIEWFEQFGDTKLHRVPSGVVGAITAWNGAAALSDFEGGAAIAAGCWSS